MARTSPTRLHHDHAQRRFPSDTRVSCVPRDSGQASLELALSLPLFALLILGGAEIANIGWAAIQLNNAAHAGAQFASLSRTNAVDITDIEAAARSEAPALTITFPTAPTQTCSCVTPSGTPTTYPCSSIIDSCASPDIIVDSVQVTTQAVVSPLIHYTGLPASYTLHGKATMEVIQ
ncbi:MAG TPA: TadE/TadG family type IV pilus assembly protein [Acidobacteriaceae bacterium]|nr:TadE/TadG family type IV pilus assembly protein [Acidobacteriaceae bacterium]